MRVQKWSVNVNIFAEANRSLRIKTNVTEVVKTRVSHISCIVYKYIITAVISAVFLIQRVPDTLQESKKNVSHYIQQVIAMLCAMKIVLCKDN